MSLPKRYRPATTEPELVQEWEKSCVYHFDPDSERPIFSVDTPPPTVSGELHLGHVYSYSHADFIARFWRMKGHNVFYPIGFDDNGLPTERLVERELEIHARTVGRKTFTERCLEVSERAEEDYRALWKRLGLSFDWRYSYRTIDEHSRRAAQESFLRLYVDGRAYRRRAPTIWCPNCETAIAQAEVDDLELATEFVTVAFRLEDATLPIATTRPELLSACVAVFVHPDDERAATLVGEEVTVPLYGQRVPILADGLVDPEKGSGVVMCCTFGDTTDVEWWYRYDLPLVEAIDRRGEMTAVAGEMAGMPAADARRHIIELLDDAGALLDRKSINHMVRVHERDDMPVEYLVTNQWFVHVLDRKQELLEFGERVVWHPEHMQHRYRSWVENLSWDWGISRQRYFGVPFPVWYCNDCGAIVPADSERLPIDPTEDDAPTCPECGGGSLTPEQDVMDTWATSSLSPAIAGRWLRDPDLFQRLRPYSMRPQAHEIIRTWAFYTMVKSLYHFDEIPWTDVVISGWGLAPEGNQKISKSRGGGPMSPLEMISRYSADAVRYWAASTGLGRDTVISEEKVEAGTRLVTKLWNVARFSQRFMAEMTGDYSAVEGELTAADRWILAATDRTVRAATRHFEDFDYAAARSDTEAFFWNDLADNYLEFAKGRLYNENAPGHAAAVFALGYALRMVLKLLAPILPFVTEEIHRRLFATPHESSIHRARWPRPRESGGDDDTTLRTGEIMVDIATAVRRYKTANQIALGTPLLRLQVAAKDEAVRDRLRSGAADLKSVTRAEDVAFVAAPDGDLVLLDRAGAVWVAVAAPEPEG